MVSPESKEIVNPEPHIRPLEEERLNNMSGQKGSVSQNRATYNIQVGTIEPKSRSKIIDKLRGGENLFRLGYVWYISKMVHRIHDLLRFKKGNVFVINVTGTTVRLLSSTRRKQNRDTASLWEHRLGWLRVQGLVL